jgi:Gpi18-like mannosyltransferase
MTNDINTAVNPELQANPRSQEVRWQIAGLVILSLLAFLPRLAMLPGNNLDLIDHFLPWLESIRTQGFWAAIATPFSRYGYTPFYSYTLGLADALFPAGTDGKVVIKSVSILFDYITAGIMFLIARMRWPQGNIPLLAYGAVLFAPTVLLNSAWWGQSDIVYSSFLLACMAALFAQRPVLAMLAFGVACAIKLQAAWLGPFILLMALRGEIRWWSFALIPLTYIVIAVPSLAAGRSLVEVLTIYLTQAGTQTAYSHGAPNLLMLLDYAVRGQLLAKEHLAWLSKVLILIAAAASLWFAMRGRSAGTRKLDVETLLVAALVSTLLVPSLLPHMHNRYFFPADILSIALAVWIPRYWPVAVSIQAASFFAYISWVFGTWMLAQPVPPVLDWIFTNNLQPVTGLQLLAGFINAGLLIFLWRNMEIRLHHHAAR